MEKIDQILLDQIQYLHVAVQLPDELKVVYEKLPKKQDGTLNMERKNKVCYTFVGQALSNKKLVELLQKTFGPKCHTPEPAEVHKPETPIRLTVEEEKEAIAKHTAKQYNVAEIDELIEHLEGLLAKGASLLGELKVRVKYYQTT